MKNFRIVLLLILFSSNLFAKSITYRLVFCKGSRTPYLRVANSKVIDKELSENTAFKIVGNSFGIIETFYCQPGSDYSEEITQDLDDYIYIVNDEKYSDEKGRQHLKTFFKANSFYLYNIMQRYSIERIQMTNNLSLNDYSYERYLSLDASGLDSVPDNIELIYLLIRKKLPKL